MLISHSGYMSRCIRRGHIPDCRSSECLPVSRQINNHMFIMPLASYLVERRARKTVCFPYETAP